MKESEAELRRLWDVLREVQDPELPTINVVELGIVREIELDAAGVTVKITPTYSGCPALNIIENDIVTALKANGVSDCRVELVLSPPWTTAWLSEETKSKLKAEGYSPPTGERQDVIVPFSTLTRRVPCPRCDSTDTTCTSEFGPTACKALYRCNACLEPFELFKDI